MARYIFIVSVRHPALYDYLQQRFADDPNAQVVLDRRRVERRRADIAVTRERRQAYRRQRPDVSEELRRRSVAVVTQPTNTRDNERNEGGPPDGRSAT